VTVTVTFLALHDEANRVRTFIFQDAPEFRTDGGHDDLHLHEVLELLRRLGASDQDSQNILELVLGQPNVQRRQFLVDTAQVVQAKQYLPGDW
jgi:hypothetical protein